MYTSGCTLPVEMFFPGKEFPTPALEAALAEMGVVCRPLPDLQPQGFPPSNATDTETDLSGFTMKVAALVLSRFQEVHTPIRGIDVLIMLIATVNHFTHDAKQAHGFSVHVCSSKPCSTSRKRPIAVLHNCRGFMLCRTTYSCTIQPTMLIGSSHQTCIICKVLGNHMAGEHTMSKLCL